MSANSDESSEEMVMMMMMMVTVMRLMCKMLPEIFTSCNETQTDMHDTDNKSDYSFYVVSLFFLSISTEVKLYRHMAAFCDDILGNCCCHIDPLKVFAVIDFGM